jgi:hypothetical protein
VGAHICFRFSQIQLKLHIHAIIKKEWQHSKRKLINVKKYKQTSNKIRPLSLQTVCGTRPAYYSMEIVDSSPGKMTGAS